MLEIRGLHVYYGQSHALQGVDLTLGRGVLSVVGRNGMGKTTLCKAIMGLVPVSGGTIAFNGQTLNGRSPGEIARAGIGYVPQGRRLWRSLTVDEHLRLVVRSRGAWTVERIYSVFPRLAERKNNGGAQLSGGEQQMLAISRALLLDPKLLVMDEPTEGLAPVIVDQVADMLERLGREGNIHVLVIEQNIGVATSVSEDVAVMVNGRVTRVMDSATLFADRDLQQRLLGVGRHGHEAEPAEAAGPVEGAPPATRGPIRIYVSNPAPPTRWSKPVPVREIEGAARTMTETPKAAGPVLAAPRRSMSTTGGVVVVAGAFDTRGDELRFVRDLLKAQGLPTRLIDLSTSGRPSGLDVPPQQVAGFHPRGSSGVFTGSRASAAAGMALAFERYMQAQADITGIIAVTGTIGSTAAAAGMCSLPFGVPKLLVSPSSPEALRVPAGASDLIVVPALAESHGLHALARETLRNAAFAIAGAVKARVAHHGFEPTGTPVLGLTRADVVMPVAERVTAGAAGFDVLAFAADGIGGRRLEALARQGRIDLVLDLALGEIADAACGGAFPAERLNLGSLAYIGACGGLDMVRLGPTALLPPQFRGRRLAEYAPGLLAMRTSPEDAAAIGRRIGERLNAMSGAIQLFLPQGGLSELSRPGGPFDDPAADAALFSALEQSVRQVSSRQLVRVPGNINDPPLTEALLGALSAHGAGPRRAAGGRL